MARKEFGIPPRSCRIGRCDQGAKHPVLRDVGRPASNGPMVEAAYEECPPSIKTSSLYVQDGDHFVPTVLTAGPWRPDAMHGGAPSALVGALVDAAVQEGEQVAAVQIDLERPVPLEPLSATVRRDQVSRRIGHLRIELSTAAGRVVGAKALLLHTEPITPEPVPPARLPRPEELPPVDWSHLYPGPGPLFVRDAVDHRVVHGGYGEPAPSSAWLRLMVPVVEGLDPSPLSQLLAVADFGSPLGQTGAVGAGLGLINVDVNVTMFRPPVGPWFYLDATDQVGPGGIGLAVTNLSDVEGPLGVVTQSQIVRIFRPQNQR
jgi:hypothetical protein